MHIDLLHRFRTTPAYYYDACLVKGQPDMLGVLYPEIPPGSDGYHGLISLALFNLQQRKCEWVITYDADFNEGYSPDAWNNPERHHIEDAILRYDVAGKRWVIVQLYNGKSTAIRTVTTKKEGAPVLSLLCRLYSNKDIFSLRPFLDLEMMQDCYRLLSHNPASIQRHHAPEVTIQDIVPHQGLYKLKERRVFIRPGAADISGLTSLQEWLKAVQRNKTLTPGNESVFIRNAFANISSLIRSAGAIKLTKQTVIAHAEMAMTIAAEQTRLVVLCSPAAWVWSVARVDTDSTHVEEQWHIWLTGWERSKLLHRWSHALAMTAPVGPAIPPSDPTEWRSPDIPAYKYSHLPEVDAVAIAGPLTFEQRPTFVVALAMLDQEKRLQSQGICLDHDGRIVHECHEQLGRYPTLCSCQEMVVGVDLLAQRWQLWNWAVLDEEKLHNTIALEPTCQRAFVRAQPEAAYFWLIEELPDGVRVSKRDVYTLDEITPASQLLGTQLLYDQEGDRPLDGHRVVGLLPYRETLLLLLLDEQNAGTFVLYQAYAADSP